MNEVSGRDMNWFFDQFVWGTNWLNYKVEGVASDKVELKLGSYVENGKRITVTESDAERREGAKEARTSIACGEAQTRRRGRVPRSM